MLGMLLTTSSLIGMPLLGRAKQRARTARFPGNPRRGHAESALRLSGRGRLAGLVGNALFGAWWLDPMAALFIAGVAVREGIETWRGEGCCTAGPSLDPTAACREDCCR